MPKRSLGSLGPLVRRKRGDRKLREAAREIGIGPATLLRIESGRTPDLDTFALVCKWLEVDPGDFLRLEPGQGQPSPTIPMITAHLRADRTPDQKTISCLAQMIALVAKLQPQPQTNG